MIWTQMDVALKNNVLIQNYNVSEQKNRYQLNIEYRIYICNRLIQMSD